MIKTFRVSVLLLFSILLLTACSDDMSSSSGKGASNYTSTKVKKVDIRLEGERNAKKHPASAGSKLYGSEFIGLHYYFKGELIKTERVEGLFDEFKDALLVKNNKGFVLVVFLPYDVKVVKGDTIEVWGPLSGDGYGSTDLGVRNVVGVTGAMNVNIVKVNGDLK